MVTGYEGFEVPTEKYHVITTALVTNSGVRDIFIAEDRYALLATGSGLDIVDLFAGEVVSSGIVSGTETLSVAAEFTTGAGNLYLGTTTSGIYTAYWRPLRTPGLDFSDQLHRTFTTTTTPSISDNRVNDLDVIALPYRLLISTGSGVDFITNDALSATRPLLSGSSSCYLTSTGGGYWAATNSGVEVNYDLNPSSGTGVIGVDFEYNAADSNPLLPSHVVTDIDVVEGSTNLLNFSTTAGDFVVEELPGAEAASQTKSLYTQETVVSAVFSEGATFDTTGTKYVTTTGAVRVFGLVDNTLSGTHFQDISVAEKYTKENTRDQALLSGTNTLVRTTSVA